MKVAILAVFLATYVALCFTFPYPKEMSSNKALIAVLQAMAQDFEEANIEASGGFQIGTAIVGNGANSNANCKAYVGKKATGRHNSCDHNGCSQAKRQAQANLNLGVPHNCQRYITTGPPCDYYHCNK